jgi:hypothetical protein
MALYFMGVFALLLVIEAAFAAWWDIPDDSLLPLFGAGAVLFLPLVLLRAARRDPRPRFEAGHKWADEHVIASSAVLAVALLLFLLVWGVVVREPWGENLASSAGAAAAVFGAMVAFSYAEEAIRRREARKRGIAPEEYEPGKLARRLGWTLACILAAYLALGFAIELSDALG